MNVLAILMKIILMIFLCSVGKILIINVNKLGHNYEKNQNIQGHFAYFCPERVLAKHLNVCQHVTMLVML